MTTNPALPSRNNSSRGPLFSLRRYSRHFSGRRPNPVRELIVEQRRAAEVQRTRARADKLHTELPAIIESQVGEHMQKLENRLIEDFREMGEKVVQKGAAALSEQLDERIESLERMSSFQTGTITRLQQSSRLAEQKVSSVVNSIEQHLAETVPGGFRLDPHYPNFYPQLEGHTTARAECLDMELLPAGHAAYCPSCSSTDVRRAYRKGFLEEALRLFFIAPYRCRACRHKFYRF